MVIAKNLSGPKKPEAKTEKDTEKHLEVLHKIMTVKFKEMEKGLHIHAGKTKADFDAIEKKCEIINRDNLETLKILSNNAGIAKELDSTKAQLKILSAGIGALAKQVEALQKAAVGTADLKGLENKVLSAVDARIAAAIKKK